MSERESEPSGIEGLIKGVEDFQAEAFQEREDLFQKLAQGQRPEALFITCSDSRVNPNLITQTEPGELFILRNAGNIIPPYGAAKGGGEEATVEYAVLALNVEHIIVCGHSHCGAMRGLVNPDEVKKLHSVDNWLQHASATRLIIEERYKDVTGDDLEIAAAEENVMMQIQNLQTHPAVALRLAQGRMQLHSWMYHFESGKITAYDPEERAFVPLQDLSGGVVPYPILRDR